MLPVGAKVVMSDRGRKTYKDSSRNPHDMVGEIRRHKDVLQSDNSFIYDILWENGWENIYRIYDVVPVIDPNKELSDYL